MAKQRASEIVISDAVAKETISERDIILLKSRLNRGENIDFSPIEENDVFVTDEQAEKGLNYLIKHFLTSKNLKRKNCLWGDTELKAIGYNGEGEELTPMNPHKLFKLVGFMNIGNFMPFYQPIYEINGLSYYMNGGEPRIY
jgi:hypothetical protein